MKRYVVVGYDRCKYHIFELKSYYVQHYGSFHNETASVEPAIVVFKLNASLLNILSKMTAIWIYIELIEQM